MPTERDSTTTDMPFPAQGPLYTRMNELLEESRSAFVAARDTARKDWQARRGILNWLRGVNEKPYLEQVATAARTQLQELSALFHLSEQQRVFLLAAISGHNWLTETDGTLMGVNAEELKSIRALAHGWQPFHSFVPATTCTICNTDLHAYDDVCACCGSYVRLPSCLLDLLFPTWNSLTESFAKEPSWRTSHATGQCECGSLKERLDAAEYGLQDVRDTDAQIAVREAIEHRSRLASDPSTRQQILRRLAQSLDISWLIGTVEQNASRADLTMRFDRHATVLQLLEAVVGSDYRIHLARQYLEDARRVSDSLIRELEASRGSWDFDVVVPIWGRLMMAMAPYVRSVLMALDMTDPVGPPESDGVHVHGSRIQIMVREGLCLALQPDGFMRFAAVAPYSSRMHTLWNLRERSEIGWTWDACMRLRDRRTLSLFKRMRPLRGERWADSMPEGGGLMTNYRFMVAPGFMGVYDCEPPAGCERLPLRALQEGIKESRSRPWCKGMSAMPFFQRWPDPRISAEGDLRA